MAESNNENESYKVTARKWRPKEFDDVTSQEFITKTLRNAIKNNRISHAYLFSGPRGVGKTTVARLLAKSLNCNDRKPNGEPCNKCDSCNEIINDNRNHPDVFEIDGASNRNIDDVRELKEKVKYGPVRSKFKIFIIDEVHMLTGASFNALLKTLEEPPPYVVFIFATTSPEKVPLTILGRCQKFDFKRLTINEITLRLKFISQKENIKVDKESLFYISKKGDGSMRDAQGLFDMAASYCENDITFEKLKSFFNLAKGDVYFDISDFIKNKDAKGLLNYFDSLMDKGYDMQIFLDGLTEHYRNLLISCSTGSVELILESESIKQKYTENIPRFTQLEIINSLKLILQTEYTFKYSSNQRTLIEALLVELIKFTDTREISQILEELKELKSGSNSTGSSFTQKSTSGIVASTNPVSESTIKVSYKQSPAVSEYKPSVSSELTASVQIKAEETLTVDISTVDGDLNTHWITIKDQIKSERKWVYSIIKDTTFEQDDKSNLLIKVDDTSFELIDGYKDYLAGKISKYFGESLSIGLVKSSEFISSATNTIYTDVSGSLTAPENQDNFDKIRSILIKDFNAKEINTKDVS